MLAGCELTRMRRLGRAIIGFVEALDPRVRRRRRQYALVESRIAEQDVPDGSFRCDACEMVQSQFAVGAVRTAEDVERADHASEIWCLDCVDDREATLQTEGRSLAGFDRE